MNHTGLKREKPGHAKPYAAHLLTGSAVRADKRSDALSNIANDLLHGPVGARRLLDDTPDRARCVDQGHPDISAAHINAYSDGMLHG
jgi:hypothetical protein